MVGFDDGAADGQTHAHATLFLGGKGVKNAVGLIRWDARAVVGHLDADLALAAHQPHLYARRDVGGFDRPFGGVEHDVVQGVLQQQGVGWHGQ